MRPHAKTDDFDCRILCPMTVATLVKSGEFSLNVLDAQALGVSWDGDWKLIRLASIAHIEHPTDFDATAFGALFTEILPRGLLELYKPGSCNFEPRNRQRNQARPGQIVLGIGKQHAVSAEVSRDGRDDDLFDAQGSRNGGRKGWTHAAECDE